VSCPKGDPHLSFCLCRGTSDMLAAVPRCLGKSWWWCCPDWRDCTSVASTSPRRSGSPWGRWGWRRPPTQEVGAEHIMWRYVPVPLTMLVTHVR
jgi:hypothetical protein